MPNSNKISAVLSDADKASAIADIKLVVVLLSFLINLSEEDRKVLRKMGPKSVEYVNLNLQGAQSFGSLLPASFNVTEFTNDVTLVNQLLAVHVIVASLLEGINDTILAAGSDAMMAADIVYGYLKTAAKTNANVKTLVSQIALRYSAQSAPRKKSSSTPSAKP
jgi:hypothetical protein